MNSSAAVCEAVLRLRGPQLAEALEDVLRTMLDSSHGLFLPAGTGLPGMRAGLGASGAAERLGADIVWDGQYYGRYEVARGTRYGEAERQGLTSLAGLTASLLHMHSLAQRAGCRCHQCTRLVARLRWLFGTAVFDLILRLQHAIEGRFRGDVLALIDQAWHDLTWREVAEFGRVRKLRRKLRDTHLPIPTYRYGKAHGKFYLPEPLGLPHRRHLARAARTRPFENPC